MSFFAKPQEDLSVLGAATIIKTTIRQRLLTEDSEEEFPFEPIVQYRPEIGSQVEIPFSGVTYERRIVESGTFIGPWLPSRAKKLREKAKRTRVSPSELVRLMGIIADRAIEHFNLPPRKFAAITFSGKIAELADTKMDLLSKIQGIKYHEEIFLWKVGSRSFSGRV